MNNIENILKEKKIYISETKGDSMTPMLTEGKDKVIIIPPVFPLKKGDLPVYRRDGHYTMHRIVAVKKGRYIICGDNRSNFETDITDNDIIGVLSAFIHNGKIIKCTDKKYLKYTRKILIRKKILYYLVLFKRFFK